MMRCRTIRQWIVEFATDGVDPARESAFRAHLAGCPRCAAEWQAVESVTPLLAAVPPATAPETTLTAIRSGVAAALDADDSRPRPHRYSLAALAAATCLFAGLWIGLRGPDAEDAPQAPVAEAPADLAEAPPPAAEPLAAPAEVPEAPPAAAEPSAPAKSALAVPAPAPPTAGRAPRARPTAPRLARPPAKPRRVAGARLGRPAPASAGRAERPRPARRTRRELTPARPVAHRPRPLPPPAASSEATVADAAGGGRAEAPTAGAGFDPRPTDSLMALAPPVVRTAPSELFMLRAEEAEPTRETAARRPTRPAEATAAAVLCVEPAVIESRVVPTVAARVDVP